MTITDTQFEAWLASDSPRVVIYEQDFACEVSGAPAVRTVYLANRPYTTGPSDSPPAIAHRDRLRKAAAPRRSINLDTIGGRTAVSVGNVTLDNADGELDFLLDLVIDGREARFYLGDPSWSRADFRLIVSGVAEIASGKDDKTIEVRLRDHRLLLDKELAGSVVNDERRKPLVYCSSNVRAAKSVEPVQTDAANLIYAVVENYTTDDGTVTPNVQALYDNGVDLNSGSIFTATEVQLTVNAGTDTLTKTAHGLAVNDVIDFVTILGSFFLQGVTAGTQYWVISAGLTADDFRISATKGGAAVNLSAHVGTGTVSVTRKRYFDSVAVDGTVTLSSQASGRLLADVIAYPQSRVTLDTMPSSLILALLLDHSGLDSSQIDSATFYELLDGPFATPNPEWCAVAITDRQNLLDVLDEIARVSQLFYGPDHEGVFHCGRLNLSGLDSEAHAYSLSASDFKTAPSIENRAIVTGTVVINSQRNMVPLSYGEIASSVGVDDARAFAAQFREVRESTAPSGTAYSTNWQGFHLTATRVEVAGAFQADSTDITQRADDILADLKPHVKILRADVDLRSYVWRLGSVVRVTYPRYGLDGGVNFRLAAIEPDIETETVKIALVTRIAPDITTAAYP